jgi:lipoprotein-releasing system permease protein
MVRVKGVDDNFTKLVDIKSILYGNGTFKLHSEGNEYGVFGLGVLDMLGLRTDFVVPVDVYAPRKGAKINLTNPNEDFNNEALLSPKVGFMVKQDYDSQYVITSIAFARRLFERQGYVSALELKVADGVDVADAKKEVEAVLGDKYRVLDRYEQQSDTYRIMEIEKLVSYIFLTFILAVACFNIIGSLSMLIIEKRDNMNTLRSFGADNKMISNIFVFEGLMVSLMGAVAGIIFGLLFCIAQEKFGFITTGGSGEFIMSSYPVKVVWSDVAAVFVTVLVTGFAAVWLPVRLLTRKFV